MTMTQAMATLQEIGGDAAVALVRRQPDPQVQKLVSTWAARFDTARAASMGFKADSDFRGIVRAYVEDNPQAIRVPVNL